MPLSKRLTPLVSWRVIKRSIPRRLVTGNANCWKGLKRCSPAPLIGRISKPKPSKPSFTKRLADSRSKTIFLKKKLPSSLKAKRGLIEPNHPQLSLRRQCHLVDLHRSGYYYEPAKESEENLHLMRLIDEEYMRHPFLGSRRLCDYLQRQGYGVNRKRIQRLMRLMGIEALYPKPKTSVAQPEHKVYPYRLNNVDITEPDQVWSTDITYLPMPTGFMYLSAVIDWYSRYILSWALSNTLDGYFCLDAFTRPWPRANRRSSIPLRALNLLGTASPTPWRPRASSFRWMAGDVAWITSLLSDSGAV